MTVAELNAHFPMPWGYAVNGGAILLLDSTGKEVPVFDALDFLCTVTRQVNPEGDKE